MSGYFLLIIAYQCLDGFTPVYMTLKEGGRFSLKTGRSAGGEGRRESQDQSFSDRSDGESESNEEENRKPEYIRKVP